MFSFPYDNPYWFFFTAQVKSAGITLTITGKIKCSDEGAQFYFVRVNCFVMPRFHQTALAQVYHPDRSI
jgi:hypothetical protein